MELSDEKRAKLNAHLYRLSELVKSPPMVIDHYEWVGNVEEVMKDIRAVSKEAYEQLTGLINGVTRQGEEHVYDLDNDESPNVLMRSEELYNESVAFLMSEINRLKSI